jgi:hypothetical protein
VRLVRLYDSDGGMRLVDFAAEMRDASRAVRDLERATAGQGPRELIQLRKVWTVTEWVSA